MSHHSNESQHSLDDLGEDIEESNNELRNNSESAAGDGSELVSTCNIAMDDLLLSGDMIDAAIANKDMAAAQAELDDLHSTNKRFEAANNDLLKLYKDDVNKTNLYMDKRRKFLLLFKSERNRLLTMLAKNKPSPTVTTNDNPSNSVNSSLATKSNLRIPKVTIPVFDGDWNKWIPFKNLYTSLIDSSPELSDLEKHSYLRSLLSGQPEVLVRNISITGANYSTALDIIKKHYDDPYRQLNNHFHSLYTAQSVNPKVKTSLRDLIVQFRQHVAGLNTIFTENSDIDQLSQCLIYWFLVKTDKNTRTDWERELAKSKSFAKFDDFIDYMDARCSAFERAVENTQASENTAQKKPTSTGNNNTNKKSKVALPVASENSESSRFCVYCKEHGHFVPSCPGFRELKPADRLSFVKKRRLCHFCFRGNCNPTMCSKKLCYRCRGKHNTLLHLGNSDKSDKKSENTSECNYKADVFYESNCILNSLQDECVQSTLVKASYVSALANKTDFSVNVINEDSLLATAIVTVENTKYNLKCEARALIDSCSELNFITQNLADKMNLSLINSSFNLNAIAGLSTNSQKITNLKISSLHSNFSQIIDCSVLNIIVKMLPSEQFSVSHWNIPLHVSLADPHFNIPGNIDMLLGVKIFWEILELQKINLGPRLPILWNTKLGWLITGSMSTLENNDFKHIFYIEQSKNNLINVMEKFWKLEEITKKSLTADDHKCEQIFQKTTIRKPNGTFQVGLPFKRSHKLLGSSKKRALKRFYYLEKRLSVNPQLQKAYIEGMRDYINKHHFIVTDIDPYAVEEDEGYYLAHHAIVKESSSSTRVRIVSDASMNSSTNISLNDLLFVGPVVQQDLFTILIQFRLKKFVFMADIVQMYRQISMDPAHTKFQRLFWRETESDPLKVYESITVTFGTSAAPYLATRCLKMLAEESGHHYPLAKPVLLNNFYVDDVLAGADSIQEALEIQNQLIELLKSAGFELSKWCSNHTDLLKNIPKEKIETKFPLSFGDTKSVKSLGLLWSPINDKYKIWLHLKDINLMKTKREILSAIGSLFDPYGLIGPIIIKAKIFMQLLWQVESPNSKNKKLNWSDNVPDDLLSLWINFASELHYLNDIEIPRFVFADTNAKFIELHGYCDASEKAYGAVLYLRSSTQDGQISVKLLCSKCKVAPLKKQSLPRLELCAALLLAELVDKIYKVLQVNLNISRVRLWSDSTITLSWISAPASKWQNFVANRTQKIQDLTYNYIWDHISGKINPADILSRGIEPSKFSACKTWFDGPTQLAENDQEWSKEINFQMKNLPEIELRKKDKLSLILSKAPNILFRKYSNLSKLIRIVAFIFRFQINGSKIGCKVYGVLNLFEYQNALNVLIKLAQSEVYSDELKALNSNNSLAHTSSLRNLSPFLDNFQILRVGGRLQNSHLSFEQKHPVLLPAKHPLSKLIIHSEHLKHCHAGSQLLKSILRRRFWIVRSHNAIRKCIYDCVTCTRFRAQAQTQFMANLPKSRVVPCKPFNITGVDYTGAVQILERGGPRLRKIIKKAYIAVFVCFTTKAIHLELVSDLTTQAFLAALTRFVSRRGVPSEIHSDNGTNFVGANNELLQLKNFLSQSNSEISKFALAQGIEWHFTPPYSPHFGGLWEAGVKSVKKHMKTIMGDLQFTFEQLSTLLCQIEAILNSRPLYPESNDPNDFNALTPGHFLIGGPITALPNKDFTSVPSNRLKHWENIQQLSQIFWKRWSTEYLSSLQQRNKWRIEKDELKIGDLVLIKENNQPPTQWHMGRITQLHPGSDGLTRVVTLKTRDNYVKRPIVKLILLPIDRD